MKARFLILFFFSVAFSLQAQKLKKLPMLAAKSMCQNDTAKAMRYIDKYLLLNDTGSYSDKMRYFRCYIWALQGKYTAAEQEANVLLKRQWEILNVSDLVRTCYPLFDESMQCAYSSILKQENIKVLKAYLLFWQQRYEESLMQLSQVNTMNMFWSGGSVNAIIKVRTEVAWLQSKNCLAIKDTSSAINYLVDYAFYRDSWVSDSVLFTLKELLLKRMTRQEIADQINLSIEHIKAEPYYSEISGGMITRYKYFFLGREIPYYSMDSSAEDLRTWVRRNERIRYLTE